MDAPRRPGPISSRVLVRISFTPGPIKTETLVCNGRSFPFSGTTFLGAWAAMGASDIPVTIGGSAQVDTPVPGGTSRTTITIRKKPGS
jgi:hypothetical protein